MRIGRG
ncbi:hypothetical protein YPPY13_0452, partial [Yersinia pestis PY-13]